MDNSDRLDDALNISPEERPRSRRTKVLEPVLTRGPLALNLQWLSFMCKKDPKLLFILDEFQDIDDNFVRSGIRHYPLDLSHFVQPELAQVLVRGRSGLPPELQASLLPRGSLHYFELRCEKRLPPTGQGAFQELETLSSSGRHDLFNLFFTSAATPRHRIQNVQLVDIKILAASEEADLNERIDSET